MKKGRSNRLTCIHRVIPLHFIEDIDGHRHPDIKTVVDATGSEKVLLSLSPSQTSGPQQLPVAWSSKMAGQSFCCISRTCRGELALAKGNHRKTQRVPIVCPFCEPGELSFKWCLNRATGGFFTIQALPCRARHPATPSQIGRNHLSSDTESPSRVLHSKRIIINLGDHDSILIETQQQYTTVTLFGCKQRKKCAPLDLKSCSAKHRRRKKNPLGTLQMDTF